MTYSGNRFGNRKRTGNDKRAALVQRLTFARSIDDLTAADLARCGLSEAECSQMLEEERARRNLRRMAS